MTRNSLYKIPLYFAGYVNEQLLEEFGTTISFSEKGDTIIRDDTKEVIGYRHFLSLQHIYKSNQFDQVDMTIFEEFCALDAGTYYDSEYEMFMSYLSTVYRHRSDFKVYMIGNVLTANNPYFEAMGIDPECLKSYGCHIYQSGGTTVCVDVAPPAYESDDEIPEYMKTKGNELQVYGIYQDKSPYVIHPTPKQILTIKQQKNVIIGDECYFYLGKIKKGKNTFPFIYRERRDGVKPNPKQVMLNKKIIKKINEKIEVLYFDSDWTEASWQQTRTKYI